MPQASVSSGTAPSDEIASTTSVASPTASLTARTSETTPVEVSDCWQKHEVDAALANGGADLVGVGLLAPGVANRLNVEAVALADRDPALAERPVADDGDAVAGRAEVEDGGLHRARAGGAEDEHVVGRADDVAQLAEHALVDRAEVGAAVMDDRLGGRREHRGRHRRRAGCEQVALLHDCQSRRSGCCSLLRSRARRPAARRRAGAPAAARLGRRPASPTRPPRPPSPGERRTAGTRASFRVYYLAGGLLTAPLLGAGSLLLTGRRWAAPVALVYTGLAVGVVLAMPVHGSFAAGGVPTAGKHLGWLPQAVAIGGNSLGTLALVGVALLTIRRRPLGNVAAARGDRGRRRSGRASPARASSRSRSSTAVAAVLLYLGVVVGSVAGSADATARRSPRRAACSPRRAPPPCTPRPASGS